MTIIYLYHKQCEHCSLNYFGKHKGINPFKYNGSGKYWKRHLKTHNTVVKTINIWGFDNQELCTEFALKFSKENNIVESAKWANLKEENGLDGGCPKGKFGGWKKPPEAVRKGALAITAIPRSDSTKTKISNKNKGKIRTLEQRLANSKRRLGTTNITCRKPLITPDGFFESMTAAKKFYGGRDVTWFYTRFKKYPTQWFYING